MARAQITNNAVTTLAGAITNVATSFNVASGGGGKFPSSGYFYVTLLDSANVPEIVKCTTRAVDTFTIVRAQDGTSARAFLSGAVVTLAPVAAVMAELVAADGVGATGNWAINAATATLSTNTAGGVAGSEPYQSATDTTAFLAPGLVSQHKVSNAGAAPTWEWDNQPQFDISAAMNTPSGNAMTITLKKTTLYFRGTTLSSGTPTKITMSADATLVVSSGSTLGTTNAVSSDLEVRAINNAGTVELAVVNVLGGLQNDETNLVTTTAEGGAGAADSLSVLYSTTARTGVTYRVVGLIRSTQATAGNWTTTPTLVQGIGGRAITVGSFNNRTGNIIGVDSVNGQTGVIDTTTFGNIGSIVAAMWVPNTTVTASATLNSGTTVAGSALRYDANGGAVPATNKNSYGLNGIYTAGGTYAGGGTALSGTWRAMSKVVNSYDPGGTFCCVVVPASSGWSLGLFVRVS
jgi:hypothetical protein